MNIYICVFIVILWPPYILNEVRSNTSRIRLKREPPMYRPWTMYGSPMRRPVYGPPRPIYGPPKTRYGAPSKPIYGPPSSIYRAPKPNYGIPSSSYGSYKPPLPRFGIPALNYRAPGVSSIYGAPPYSSSYNQNYLPPTQMQNYRPSFETSNPPPPEIYSPPSMDYGPPFAPTYSEYELPNEQGYEVPITHSPPALQYDTSSASYGTPGALTSYGTPIGNLQKRTNFEDSFMSFEDGDAYGSSSSVDKKFEKPGTNRTLNHNYEGPGVSDEYGKGQLTNLNSLIAIAYNRSLLSKSVNDLQKQY